jgi:hypothetical protein
MPGLYPRSASPLPYVYLLVSATYPPYVSTTKKLAGKATVLLSQFATCLDAAAKSAIILLYDRFAAAQLILTTNLPKLKSASRMLS